MDTVIFKSRSTGFSHLAMSQGVSYALIQAKLNRIAFDIRHNKPPLPEFTTQQSGWQILGWLHLHMFSELKVSL